ncbi:MAG TPA: VCBS repeat-containing protein, partial [Candidatus Pacearchaeota archaeon]|nr:VCBS repeat-containing protein [Candidatus Pacearchaeota archaeon]
GDTGTIWGFDNNSGQLWSFTEPTGAILSLSEGDVNNDGEAEIIAGGSDGIIWVLNKSGSLLWSYNISLGNIGGVSGSSPAIDISDINNDGINDIAVASVNGYAHILQSVTCSANFNDSTSFNMTWNNTIKKWQVNKSFSTTGDYDWNATCTKNGYTEQTSSETVTISADTTSPTVNLISPANASTDTDGNITFIYNATDNVGIANCSLYTNINGTWLLNQTSTPIVSGNNSFNITEIADGTYNWNVLCYDVNSLSDWNGANWTFTIDASDISPPIVLLEFPANNTLNTTDNSPDFVFNVTEEKASTLDCTLWLNNSAGNTTAYGNNASVLNATSTTITANTSLADGDYKWWISCFDGTNTNSSGKWNISINVDTIYASSCNKSDVESAVTIASTGDTVIVPAGNCTWNSTLSITKGIILQGAGIDNTTLINEINNTGTGDFLISINPSIIADNPYIEITGFTFDANSEGGCIRISCEDNTYSYTNFRVHHNKLKNTLDDDNSYMSFRVKGDCFGLVDNNQFVDNQYDFKIYGDDQDSWDDYPGINNLGSANYLYIENSTSTGASSFILTSGEGARWVYRYNTVNISNLSSANLILDAHGNTQNDGVVAFEGYENVFTDGSGGTMVDIRGGTSMVYNNDWQMPASNGKIQIREEDCYVNNNCDYPGTDPITDTYVWNNYKSNLNNTLVSYIEGDNETYNLIEEDRDYWTDMKIGAEGGEDSLNFFYNLSANRNATCTEDESYWETDTRKLYRCVENNTWNSIYSPFDYPHPLVSGIPGVSLFSPLNMNSTTNTTVQFNASVIDSGTLSNMTLYGNWSGSWSANETISLSSTYNESSFTKTLSAGTYLWNVYSCDVDNNCDWGNLNYTLTITAVDTTSPTVNLVSPANNTLETSSNSITFTYNVTDASSVSNCSLIINNQVNSTNTSITKDTNQTFTQTLSNADYNWSVNCTDSANNVGSSGVYNLSVNVVVDNEYPVFSSYYDNNAS